jgi:outer membrane autotransporter protein
MGGFIDGQVNQTDGLGYTSVRVPVAGGYVFFRNGGFTLDLSVRESFIDTDFTIAQAGLQKTPVGGLATTAAAYTSYSLEVWNNVLLMPYAGLSWTRSELGEFEVYTNVGGAATGLVAPGTNQNIVGRLGLQLSYVQQLTDTIYLRPFAGISGWDAFENGTNLKYYVTNGTTVNVTTPIPKDFMQVEGGLSFAESSIQATGFVKGIYKEGADVKGESVVLGGRLNF